MFSELISQHFLAEVYMQERQFKWRGPGHSVNRQTLKVDFFLRSSPSQISTPNQRRASFQSRTCATHIYIYTLNIARGLSGWRSKGVIPIIHARDFPVFKPFGPCDLLNMKEFEATGQPNIKDPVPGCDRALPTQGLPGPSGPKRPWKSRKRVRKEHPGAGPQKCRKSAPRSLKRVRKESETQNFQTLFGLFWDSGGHCFGTFVALPRGTLSGLFSDSGVSSGPKGPADPVWGGADHLQKCVPILVRGHRKKGTEKRPKSLAFKGFLRANPLCPPNPFSKLLNMATFLWFIYVCGAFPPSSFMTEPGKGQKRAAKNLLDASGKDTTISVCVPRLLHCSTLFLRQLILGAVTQKGKNWGHSGLEGFV